MKPDQKTMRPPPGMDIPAVRRDTLAGEYRLLISTDHTLNAVPLGPGVYVLGRARVADIPVEDASVSRAHARLTVDESGASIEDLGSSNGTRIGGVRLVSGQIAACPAGSVIELGSATVVLQRGLGSGQSLLPNSTPSRTPARPVRVVLDPMMKQLYAMLERVAPTTLNILVLGETGVGKEVFARAVHDYSLRSSAPLLEINVAALSPSTLEAELFGYEKGAFTGAAVAKPGLFESADGGTVFLDEVGDMPLETQVKILRVLESGETLRIGSLRPRRVDVRIVSATNRDLTAAIAGGEFRPDLYFRLNGITFTIPPLRARIAEIAPFARMFAERAAVKLGRPVPSLGPEIMRMLEAREWPGNVRELRNVIERAVVLSGAAEGRELRDEHFPPDMVVTSPMSQRAVPVDVAFDKEPPTGRFGLLSGSPEGGSRDLASELRDIERKRIVEALAATRGNQSQAARDLGVSRAVLLNRMKVFGLLPSRNRRAKPKGD